MKIQFWKPNQNVNHPATTWLVVIEDSVYEMSENAMEANGVCIYAGQESDLDRAWISGAFDCVDFVNHVPQQIVKATLQRIANTH